MYTCPLGCQGLVYMRNFVQFLVFFWGCWRCPDSCTVDKTLFSSIFSLWNINFMYALLKWKHLLAKSNPLFSIFHSAYLSSISLLIIKPWSWCVVASCLQMFVRSANISENQDLILQIIIQDKLNVIKGLYKSVSTQRSSRECLIVFGW